MSEKDSSKNIDYSATKSSKKAVIDYPSNSHRMKEAGNDIPEKKVEQITSNPVKQKKKPLGEKFADLLGMDHMDNVRDYLIHDILIPAAKKTLVDMIGGGSEMLFFPNSKKNNNTIRERGVTYVSQSSLTRNYNSPAPRMPRSFSTKQRTMHSFDDIVLSTRGEADEVLSHLVDLTVTYGAATVADLYDLVGITSNYTDKDYGWTNLGGSYVNPVRDGYLLKLPKVIVLD